jgi:hypothetical protein
MPLVLIAAYGDAAESSPSVPELARGLDEVHSDLVGALLRALIADRVLHVCWRAEPGTQRNVYELTSEAQDWAFRWRSRPQQERWK